MSDHLGHDKDEPVGRNGGDSRNGMNAMVAWRLLTLGTRLEPSEGTVAWEAMTRRCTSQEKADAVRMVSALRAELGTEHGTVQRVAKQLRYGVESIRSWVAQADIDEGCAPGSGHR